LNIAILEKKKRIVWKEKKMTNKDKKRLQALMGRYFHDTGSIRYTP
jgi:hypothetical protein